MDNLDLYRALVAKGGSDAMLAMLRDMVSDLTRKELAVQDAACSKGAERELAVKFVVGAFMAVLTSWMDRGAQLPAQKVDAIFKRFILHGVLPAKQCADA